MTSTLRRIGAILLVGAVSGTLAAADADPAPPIRTGEEPRLADTLDRVTTAAVERLLLASPDVPGRRFMVETVKGTVILRGEVGTLYERERAAAIAAEAIGATGVLDRIEVRPSSLPIDDVQLSAQRALDADPLLRESVLRVVVDALGTASVHGRVATPMEQRLAVARLMTVPGIRTVADATGVVVSTAVADDRVDALLGRGLDSAIALRGSRIRFATAGGKSVLDGSVADDRLRAVAVAFATAAGAREVEDRLTVDPALRPPDLRVAQPSDRMIADAVRATIEQDPRTGGFLPGILVRDGVVALSGTTDTRGQREAMHVDARGAAGACAVASGILARLDENADARLRWQVRSALDADPFLADAHIDVDVSDGNAWLTGTVGSQWAWDHAAEVAARVPGVAIVRLQLVRLAPGEDAASVVGHAVGGPDRDPGEADVVRLWHGNPAIG